MTKPRKPRATARKKTAPPGSAAAAAPPERAGRLMEQHEILIRPSVQNARVLQAWGRVGVVDLSALGHELRESASNVIAGDMTSVKALLYDQAVALQAIFTNLSIEASKSDSIARMEPLLRMALKAQNQSRAALETLAMVMSPPVVFARQANIANGPQQVNNGTPPAPAPLAHSKPTELLEEARDGICMDARATGTSGRADTHLAAVGAVDGAPHRAGQGPQQEQPVSGRRAAAAARGAATASTGAGRTASGPGPHQVAAGTQSDHQRGAGRPRVRKS